MIEIEFNYNQEIIVIQAKLDDLFKDVINKFFIANGTQIIPEEKVENQISIMNKKDKNNISFRYIKKFNDITKIW